MRVLITGATSGIGYQTACVLARRGHFVYLTCHTEKEVQVVKEKLAKIKDRIACFKLDITNPKDYELLQSLEIDCLICHAGIGIGGSLLDLPLDRIKENFNTNFFGILALIQKMIPSLIHKKESRIIVTSSMAGILPLPFLGSYGATKAALSYLIKTLRLELKLTSLPLQVTLIEPGIYETGFNEVMLDNKAPYFEKSPYFEPYQQEIEKIEKDFFHFFGNKNYTSIVKKFVRAVESKKVKKVYRAPFFQRLGLKLYLLFWG